MTKQRHSRLRTFIWIGLSALIVGVFGVLLVPRKHTAKGFVRIKLDKRGIPQVLGVSLGNTNVRDAVFRGMSSFGFKAAITVVNPVTNEAQASNVLNALEALNRAGLANTNQPPNPYE